MNRREFVTLVGVGGAVALTPEIGSALPNTAQFPKRKDGFTLVGTVKALEKTGQLLNKTSPVGPILIIKNPNNSSLVAVNPTCTHEGCTVKWKADQSVFSCPCHKGIFSSTGQVIEGKPKRNLALYQTKIEGGNILVKSGISA